MSAWVTLAELADQVPDGARLAIPPDYSGVAMAATLALLRRGVRDLHLICCPQAGLQADLLIGAGAVACLESAGVSLGEQGFAPRYRAAVERREPPIELLDATCPVIHAGLQAAEKGIPFMPLRGIIGSDLVKVRPDWKVIDNPMAQAPPDPILLVPAIRPDIALFHAPLVDAAGNVWIGTRRELMLMAHAAAKTLVTAEARYQGDLLADPVHAAGTIPECYITAAALQPKGMWPLAFYGDREPRADAPLLTHYAAEARHPERFAQLLERWLASEQWPPRDLAETAGGANDGC